MLNRNCINCANQFERCGKCQAKYDFEYEQEMKRLISYFQSIQPSSPMDLSKLPHGCIANCPCRQGKGML